MHMMLGNLIHFQFFLSNLVLRAYNFYTKSSKTTRNTVGFLITLHFAQLLFGNHPLLLNLLFPTGFDDFHHRRFIHRTIPVATDIGLVQIIQIDFVGVHRGKQESIKQTLQTKKIEYSELE